MPPRPARRPRSPAPQTARCRYVAARGERCRRVATLDVGLCRQHAIELERELAGDQTGVGRAIDQILGGRDPVVVVVGAVQGYLGQILAGRSRAQPPPPSSSQSPPRSARSQQPPPRYPPRPPPPPPSRADQINPIARARELLGFEPTETITLETLKTRKQALARVFHPDRPGGSLAQMKRINDAADTLERAILAKRR